MILHYEIWVKEIRNTKSRNTEKTETMRAGMITAGRLPQWSLLRIGTPPLSHFVGKYRNTKEQQRILKQQTAPQNRHTAAVTLRGELQKENSRKTQKGFRHTTVLCTWYVGSCCKQQTWSKFCKWTKIYTTFSTAGALVVITV